MVSCGPAQVEELSGQQAEAEQRAEKWQVEFRNLQEKFEALNKEKEVGGVSFPRPRPRLPGVPIPDGCVPPLTSLAHSGCWRSGTLCARPTRSCAALRCSRAARQVGEGPWADGYRASWGGDRPRREGRSC